MAPLLTAALLLAAPAGDTPIATVDLTIPFATRTPWTLTVMQDPRPSESPTGDPEPGPVTACLHHAGAEACDPVVATRFTGDAANMFATAHYLTTAKVVQRRADGRAPLLLLVTAGLHSGDGNQGVLTQAFEYRRDADRFVRVFRFATGKNNNQSARFVETGPLRGDIVTVEPTPDAPYAYWVTVNAPAPAGGYRQALRYRSATRYNDGNPLPVIDSEMPQILQRLALWRPGRPLPLPATPCPAPHLIRGALWCR